jgi:uncharacterized protein
MRIAWPDLAAALGLLLVIEGMFPFLSPRGMRAALARIAALEDGALRAAGVASMLAGVLVLWLARS